MPQTPEGALSWTKSSLFRGLLIGYGCSLRTEVEAAKLERFSAAEMQQNNFHPGRRTEEMCDMWGKVVVSRHACLSHRSLHSTPKALH